MEELVGLVGREELLATISRQVNKGRQVLLVGPAGIGKSTLLRAVVAHAQARGQRALYVAHASPAKPLLVAMAQHVHEQYRALPYAKITLGKTTAEKDPTDLSWDELYRPINRLQIRELAGLLLEVFTQERYLLGLDSLEHVTPAQKAVLLALFANAQVIGATTSKQASGHLARLWWSFKKIDVPPLDDQASRDIITRFIAAQHLLIEQPAMFYKHAIHAAGGNPQALNDILCDADKEKVVKKQYIREEVAHDAGERYFDLTPLALLAGCLVMAWRFLARGMDTPDLYLLAGVSSALFMFVRFFLYKGMARTG